MNDMYVCGYKRASATEDMPWLSTWRSEDSLWKMILSFHWGLGIKHRRTQQSLLLLNYIQLYPTDSRFRKRPLNGERAPAKGQEKEASMCRHYGCTT